MWIFTQTGYLSVVRHRDDPKLLLVRSRDRRSLEEFCTRSGLDEASIEENEAADYRFRVACPDRRVRAFVTRTLDELDYDNFKNRVTESRGWAWHDVLLRIWSATRDLGPAKAEGDAQG